MHATGTFLPSRPGRSGAQPACGALPWSVLVALQILACGGESTHLVADADVAGPDESPDAAADAADDDGTADSRHDDADGGDALDDAPDDAADGAPDDGPDVGDGTEPDPRAPLHEGVSVAEYDIVRGGSPEVLGAALGYLGELPDWSVAYVDVARDGPCVLQRSLSDVIPTFVPSADAGILHIDGLAMSVPPIALAPMLPGSPDVYWWYNSSGGRMLLPGNPITVRFDGGPDVGPGTGSVVATTPVVWLEPDLGTPPPFGAGHDLVLRWVPEAGVHSFIAISMELSGPDMYSVVCRFDSDPGAWTVPSSLVDGVGASGVMQFELARYRSGPILFPDRELVVQSVSALQVSYTGP
ncbi:MAG: hypothetical protein HY905_08400 [Deltaproteobacteria bacterium]|nr:hypothetical protein [Deltaproteobacteria bacterium]